MFIKYQRGEHPLRRYRRGWGSALARLEAAVGLVDDIGTAAAADHAVIPVTVLQRLQRVADLHGSAFVQVILCFAKNEAQPLW